MDALEKDLITASRAAEILGISVSKVRERVEDILHLKSSKNLNAS
jgi:hypothetical protein